MSFLIILVFDYILKKFYSKIIISFLFIGYENCLELDETKDLLPLITKKLILDRDVKRCNMMIHGYENDHRSKASVLQNVKKAACIHPIGARYGAMVSVFPFKSEGREGKDRIRVTVLFKSYDTYKGKNFFFGESSLTLNQSELSELIQYGEKIFENQGLNWETESPACQEESSDDSDLEDDMNEGLEGSSKKKFGRAKMHDKKKGKKVEKRVKKRKETSESSSDSESEKQVKRQKRE